MNTENPKADKQITIEDLTIDVFLDSNPDKSSVEEKKWENTVIYEITYKPGIIFLAPDISFCCWEIPSSSSRDQIREIMIKECCVA